VVVVVLGILWIPVMKGLGKVLYAYLQDVQSLLAPGIAAVFLLGIASKKTTPTAGLVGLISGFVLGMLRLGLKIFSSGISHDSLIYNVFLAPNWLHYEIVLFFIVLAIIIVTSMFTRKADPAAIKGLYIGSASPEEKALTRASWNNWDLVFSGLIIIVILAFYVYFW
jgi:solute:Na+ symporter, SSS family